MNRGRFSVLVFPKTAVVPSPNKRNLLNHSTLKEVVKQQLYSIHFFDLPRYNPLTRYRSEIIDDGFSLALGCGVYGGRRLTLGQNQPIENVRQFYQSIHTRTPHS